MNRKERRRANSGAAPQQVDPGLARDFRDAVEYLQAGEWRNSELAHRRVLAKVPHHAPSLHHLGLIAYKRDAGNEAVDYIRRSLASDPRYHQAWLNLAIILGELRRSAEAIEACRQCVALQPENSAAFEVLGNLLRIAENNADATRGLSRLASPQAGAAPGPCAPRRADAASGKGGGSASPIAGRQSRSIRRHQDARKLERQILAASSTNDARSRDRRAGRQSVGPSAEPRRTRNVLAHAMALRGSDRRLQPGGSCRSGVCRPDVQHGAGV